MLDQLKREVQILNGAVKCLDEIRYGDTALMNLTIAIDAVITIRGLLDKEHKLLCEDMKKEVK